MMHLVSCYYAYVTHHDQYSSAREMNIAVRDVDGFQIFLNMFQFSSFCCWEYRVSLYSLCFKGEFQRYFEGFYMCFSDLSCVWSQLNTKYKTWQLIRNPRRVFRLLTSDFRLPTSNLQLPTSVAIKGDGRPTRLLPYAKMLLVPILDFHVTL